MTDQITMINPRLCDLADGQKFNFALLVREHEIRRKKNGEEYLRLVVSDRTGRAEVMVWDDVLAVAETVPRGTVVHVAGTYHVDPTYGPRITATTLDPIDQQAVDQLGLLDRLLDGPDWPAEKIENTFAALICTIKNEHLVLLIQEILERDGEPFRHAPAAKHHHHAYRHGLLEHTLEVAHMVARIAEVRPNIDRDVAVTGAILHDIGKLDAYDPNPLAIDYTTQGRLMGEIPLSYYRVRDAITNIKDFPGDLADAVLHIVISHHGRLEHGSPAVPCTREAILVHIMDNLSAKLGMLSRLEKELPSGESWSSYDRALGGSAYFPQTRE